MDCHANFTSIVMPGTMQVAAPGGLRRVTKPPAGAAAPYAADYSFIFLSETKR